MNCANVNHTKEALDTSSLNQYREAGWTLGALGKAIEMAYCPVHSLCMVVLTYSCHALLSWISGALLYPTGVYRIPKEAGGRLPASQGLETRLDRERSFACAVPSQGDNSHGHTTSVYGRCQVTLCLECVHTCVYKCAVCIREESLRGYLQQGPTDS